MLSRLTLRMRLTVLYGALFSASIVAVVATAGVIWPDFLRAHASQQAPSGSGPASGGPYQLGSGTHSLSAETAIFVLVVIAGVRHAANATCSGEMWGWRRSAA